MQIGDVGTADYSLFSPKIKHKSIKSIYNEGGLILFLGKGGKEGDNMQMNRLQTLIIFCFCFVFSAALCAPKLGSTHTEVCCQRCIHKNAQCFSLFGDTDRESREAVCPRHNPDILKQVKERGTHTESETEMQMSGRQQEKKKQTQTQGQTQQKHKDRENWKAQIRGGDC